MFICIHEVQASFVVCMCLNGCGCGRQALRWPVDLCPVPTVPFFSSSFSVALFFCWLFSHQLALRPSRVPTHKHEEKFGNFILNFSRLWLYNYRFLDVVVYCQISHVGVDLEMFLPWWQSYWQTKILKSKLTSLGCGNNGISECVGALNASCSWHMTHPTYCT